MSLTKNKFMVKCVLLFSVIALTSAYFVQYILDHQPCNLCLFERIPYLFAVILISLTLILNKYEKIISIILALVFILGSIISFYHIGIEQEFFNESFVCELSRSKSTNISASELLKELEKKTVSCKDVTFTFLGVSLATFNAILSLALSTIMIKNIIKHGKN